MLINIIFEFTGNNLFQLIILLFITIATRVYFLPNVLEINEIKYKEKIGQLGTKIDWWGLKEAERKDILDTR